LALFLIEHDANGGEMGPRQGAEKKNEAADSGQPRCLKNVHIRQSARGGKKGPLSPPRERGGPDLTRPQKLTRRSDTITAHT
jgi:hypothetical protein